MMFLIGNYWPFILVAALAGVAVGWWSRYPRDTDEITAWLEHGPRR